MSDYQLAKIGAARVATCTCGGEGESCDGCVYNAMVNELELLWAAVESGAKRIAELEKKCH